MSCDNNFKSQEHLKSLGTAVEIECAYWSAQTHSSNQGLQLNFQDTVYNQSCGSNTVWRKYLADKNETAIGAISWDCICFQYYLEAFHMRHIMLLLFQGAPTVTLHSKIHNPLGFNASWHSPHHCEKYIVMTALQCIIISRWLLSLNSMASVQDATCVVNL